VIATALVFLAVACTDPRVDLAGESTSGRSETSGSSSSSSSSPDSTSVAFDESSTSSSDAASTSISSDDRGLIGPNDFGHTVECDVWAQDCPKGEKCTFWASGDSTGLNASRCVPVARDPVSLGEMCTVSDRLLSGLDDCDSSSICYYVDEQTLTGECVALCQGSEAHPSCDAPDEVCVITDDSVLIICRQACDPLVQDCPNARVCLVMNDAFVCEQPAPGRGGSYGEPCDFGNACAPGLVCAAPEWVPGCVGAGCCSPFCDVTQLDADAQCPGVALGQECVAWFEEGQAPAGHEDVGVCAIPN